MHLPRANVPYIKYLQGDVMADVIVHEPNQTTVQRSWSEAYLKFLSSGRENIFLKIAPLALVGIIPLSILDDVLLPIIGVADDIPTSILVAAIVALTWNRVRKYR
jgi:hypothetical protein